MLYSLLGEVQVSGTANDMAAPLTPSCDGQKHSLPLNPSVKAPASFTGIAKVPEFVTAMVLTALALSAADTGL